jgi:sugar diacid utilization regulator
MKVIFNIDCTPEEARQFFGLPDVVPMQEMMMKEVEAKMQDNIKNLDPESFMKTWMPATMQGWGEMQKMFWSQMGVDPSKMPGMGMGMPPSSEKK